QLDNLRMVDKQIDMRPKLPHIPVENLRIRRLKHDLVRRQLPQNLLNHIRPPIMHILRDAFTLNHDALYTRIDEALSYIDNLGGVGCAHALEFFRCGVAAGAELDPAFGFGDEACAVDFVDEAEPVVGWDGNK